MNNNKDNKPNEPTEQSDTKKYFWVAVVCFALGALFLGLSFTILGVYATFASMILELASVSFLNAQKKYNYFTACKVLRVVSYVVMGAGLAIVLGLIGFKLS
jgi:hypothetical protein